MPGVGITSGILNLEKSTSHKMNKREARAIAANKRIVPAIFGLILK